MEARFSVLSWAVLLVMFLGNVPWVVSDWREDAARATKEFAVWTKFEKGYDSVTVALGEKLPIRCRVASNGTEWKDDNDLQNVTMTFFKDEVELPDYWSNRTLAEEDGVVVHSKVAFEYSVAQGRHRGWYSCQGVYEGLIETEKFYVRIKEEKWGWPSLILGVEVVILVVIYYFYEKWLLKGELKLDDE